MKRYVICPGCGRLVNAESHFCTTRSCHVPLFDFSRAPKVKTEGLFLGYFVDRSEFRLPLNQLGYHVAIYGVTGVGKTRLAIKLAIEAENNGLKLLILDVEGEWKKIIPFLKAETEYYEVDRNLKVNPFDLNDRGLAKTLLKETIFKGIEVEYAELSPQMNYVLEKCIEMSSSIPELIDNILYFEPDTPFNLSNLNKTKTALIVRLDPYKANPALNEIFYCYSSNPDLNKLDDRNIIFDLHSLEARVAYRTELRLLYNTIAIAYLRQALSREITNETKHLFITDEAQLLAPKILRKLVVTDTWTSTEFATRLRKRGECIVFITQSPSNIEDDVRRNAQNNFVFRLQDPDDIKLIAGILGWNVDTSLEYLTTHLTNLKRKQALVKVPFIKDPFLIEVSDLELPELNERELRKYVKSIKHELNEYESLFLQSIDSKPFLPVVERRRWLGMDKLKYKEVVERLVSEGIIEKVSVPIGRGRPIVLYQRKGQKPSVKHEYYVYWLIDELTDKGLVCRIARIGEAKPDIQIPSIKTAINVELGKSDIKKNIKEALKEFERVIVCSDDEKLLEKLKEENKDERILFRLVWEVPGLL